MWNTILGVTSIIWIFASVFLIYAAGRLLVTFDWKIFVIAVVIWFLVTTAEIIVGMME